MGRIIPYIMEDLKKNVWNHQPDLQCGALQLSVGLLTIKKHRENYNQTYHKQS